MAFPSAPQSDLIHRLPKDFAREGWLWKTGPRPSDAHRRRWFTLDNRKLMYHDEKLDAYPKGEIFIGELRMSLNVIRNTYLRYRYQFCDDMLTYHPFA